MHSITSSRGIHLLERVPVGPDDHALVARVAEVEGAAVRIIPDAVPRNVGDRHVAASLAVVLEAQVNAARALRQHVLEHQATEQRERVVVCDVAQALRRSVGTIFLSGRARECLWVGARFALHPAEQLQLILDLVDRNDRLAAFLRIFRSSLVYWSWST